LITRASSTRGALDMFERHLEQAFAEMSPKRAFVHAGVVAIGGRAILIPGASGAGKTFLVRRLLERGAVLYSDEYAVLDARGRVHPYPRPMRLGGRSERRAVTPEEIGATVGRRPIRISHILITEHRRGARWNPRPLSSGRGLLAMMGHTVHVRYQPRRVLPILAGVVAQAAVLESLRGEADVVADWLFQCLEGKAER